MDLKTPGLDLFLWLLGVLCLITGFSLSTASILSLFSAAYRPPPLTGVMAILLLAVGALAIKASFR